MSQPVKVAIMQPYFLPYIGYWQLMHHVDIFVVYDDIEYTKKGWISRNRFLLNGQPETFSLPLKKDSDYLDVCERQLSETASTEKLKLMRRLDAAYRNAEYFREGKSLLVDIFASTETNLFRFIYQSIEHVRVKLGMTNRLIVSSTLDIPRQIKGQNRVIAICKALEATNYINPIGGIDLYDKQAFCAEGIQLHFQQVRPFQYDQFQYAFVPNLSILDCIMFTGIQSVSKSLTEMDIYEPYRS
jgi:hypothetical protein